MATASITIVTLGGNKFHENGKSAEEYINVNCNNAFFFPVSRGCSNASGSEIDHASMNHSEMNHSDMDKPLPNTKDQEEIRQQEFSNSISRWHDQNIKGKNVKVAVLDTGIDKDNKDLTYIKGINFVGESKENFDDDNGHGTKISGIIGASENNYNLLGIAPDSDLYMAKVADENGNVKVENLIKGINWAVKEDVDVINISLERS